MSGGRKGRERKGRERKGKEGKGGESKAKEGKKRKGKEKKVESDISAFFTCDNFSCSKPTCIHHIQSILAGAMVLLAQRGDLENQLFSSNFSKLATFSGVILDAHYFKPLKTGESNFLSFPFLHRNIQYSGHQFRSEHRTYRVVMGCDMDVAREVLASIVLGQVEPPHIPNFTTAPSIPSL